MPGLNGKDTTKIVEDSLKQSKPMVVVAMQYRLNIFAFGDGKSAKNLALKDQRLAIEWVRKHIAGFGGDPVSQYCAEPTTKSLITYCRRMLLSLARVLAQSTLILMLF